MLKKLTLAAALVLSLTAAIPHSFADSAAERVLAPQTADSLHQAALDALGEDASRAALAVRTLRAAGQLGLDAYFQAFDQIQSDALKNNKPLSDAVRKNFRPFADQIAMQKDAWSDKLYWYTDLPAAEREAQRTGKPILSLHLLGNLNEDLSCANSRFFRTTLYPNDHVQKFLRENFILHWQSERPVPVVTIDFGDGRKIIRTITGNSIHYILDQNGRLVDALPGLYGPAAFIRNLDLAKTEAAKIAAMNNEEFAQAIVAYHTQESSDIHNAFRDDLLKLKLSDDNLTDADWRKIADLHAEDARLDFTAISVMREKIAPPAEVAMRLTMSKSMAEDPIMTVIRNVEGNIAVDTVKNQYLMHETICQWLSQPADPLTPTALDPFNARIYAELFLTPKSDPWLGLAQPDIYTAIDNDGLPQVATTP